MPDGGGDVDDDERRDAGLFDAFAAAVARQVERPWFFSVCAAFVVSWVVVLVASRDLNDSVIHLWLNSPTTSATFLMVAIDANAQSRSTKAMQHKLDAIARGLADVLDQTDGVDGAGGLATELRTIAGVVMEPSEK